MRWAYWDNGEENILGYKISDEEIKVLSNILASRAGSAGN